MPMTLIKGFYRIVGASLDGDSVRFYPATRTCGRVRGSRSGRTQPVGYSCGWTPSTPWRPTTRHASASWRQPAGLGDGAGAALLDLLGFSGVARDERGYVTSATPQQTPGYILTRFADMYGRAVATAYAGGRRGRAVDGSQVHLDVEELRSSVNYRLLAAGWVYPTFYSQLYVDLREELAATALTARTAKQRVWARDATLTGFRLASRTQLTDQLVILPKLFRRLAEYLSLDETGKVNLAGFPAFLAAHNDRLFTVPAGQATSLGTLVARRGQTLHLTTPPEQIVFQEG